MRKNNSFIENLFPPTFYSLFIIILYSPLVLKQVFFVISHFFLYKNLEQLWFLEKYRILRVYPILARKLLFLYYTGFPLFEVQKLSELHKLTWVRLKKFATQATVSDDIYQAARKRTFLKSNEI